MCRVTLTATLTSLDRPNGLANRTVKEEGAIGIRIQISYNVHII